MSPPKQQNGGGEWAELMMKSVVGLSSERACDVLGQEQACEDVWVPAPSVATPGFGANHFISPGRKLR